MSKGYIKSLWLSLTLALSLTLTLTSCTQDTECRSKVKIGCPVTFAMDSVTMLGATKTLTTVDSLTFYGVDCDSVLCDNLKSQSKVLLPLRNDTTLTRYVMIINGEEDTLNILHRNDTSFMSLACGCFVYHTIDTVWTSLQTVDTIRVLDSDIAAVAKDNVKFIIHY